jgi:hypothetical protein
MTLANALADASEDLRERLLEMRSSLIEGLAASRIIEPGHLVLLGSVGAALAAIDGIKPGYGSDNKV